MKILVPTDFSKQAEAAIDYAAAMALELQADLTLLHVSSIVAPPRPLVSFKSDEILEEIKTETENDLAILATTLSRKYASLRVSSRVVTGNSVSEMILSFAEKNNFDLIISGSKGATGLKKILLGSNAAALASNGEIPVIVVPEQASFGKIKNILYPSDFYALEKEFSFILMFAQLFKADLHILHVLPAGSKEKIDPVKIKIDLVRRFGYAGIHVHVCLDDDIEMAIDDFSKDLGADMIAMFTHTPGFTEKILGTSLTREMAFHSRIPLMALKKSDAV